MRVLATVAIVLTLCTSASAQTRVVSKLVASGQHGCIPEATVQTPSEARFCACDDKPCKRTARYLSDLMLGASSGELERTAWSIVKALSLAKDEEWEPAGKVLGDVARNYYRLVWKGVDVDGKPTVYHLLLHNGRRAQPDNLLAGIEGASGAQLYDILVTDIRTVQEAVREATIARESPQDTLASAYVSTHVDNPLLAQLPDFIAKTNVLQFWASASGPSTRLRPGATPPPPRGTRFTVYHAVLPERRATIQVTDQIVTRVPDVDAVIASADAAAIRLARPEVAAPGCLVRLARAYVRSLERVAPACRVADPATFADTQEAASDCKEVLTRVLRETTAEARTSKDCATSDGWNEEITAVQGRFRAIVDTIVDNAVAGKSQLVNEPRTWMSFGLVVAGTIGEPHVADGYVRAKLTSATYAVDPMPHLLTLAVVNFHPRPYQASSESQTWKERLRVFGGVTITPDFGVAAGVGCSLVRGLSVNVGGSLMWANAVRADAVGSPIPKDVDKNRPFTLKTVAAWLFGLSYNFK